MEYFSETDSEEVTYDLSIEHIKLRSSVDLVFDLSSEKCAGGGLR